MDEVDLALVKMLMANSRLTYRDLANETKLTITAIHKRVQHLVDTGIIETFIARPNITALKGIAIGAWGTTKAKSIDEISIKLGEHESTFFVGSLSGKFIHLGAFLRDISELQNFSTFVAKTGQIEEPTIGIVSMPYPSMPEFFKNIDYKILKALNCDARKSIGDVADEVGISAKTVKKSIERMISNQLASFTIAWAPKTENNFVTNFYLSLQENSSIQVVLQHLVEKFGQNMVYCLAYSNIPNFLVMTTWAKSPGDMQKIEEELQKEGFKDVVPRIVLNGKYFDCWLDDLLLKKSV